MVDVVVTITGGGEGARRSAQAILSGGGLVGADSTVTPPEAIDLDFIDWPFLKENPPTVDEHIEAVKRHRPKYAVAPDIEKGRSLDDVLATAEEMAEYAQFVIIVPKDVPVDDVPSHFIVGVPFRNEWDTDIGVNNYEDFRGRPVHILGGNHTEQIKLAGRYDYRVTSADSPNLLKWADGGRVWVARLGGANSVRRLIIDDLIDRSYDPESSERFARKSLLAVEGVPEEARDDSMRQLLRREAIVDLEPREFIRTVDAEFMQEETAAAEMATGAPSYAGLLARRTARIKFSVMNLVQAWNEGRIVTRELPGAPGRGPPPPMDDPIETPFGETLTIEDQRERFLESAIEEEMGEVGVTRALVAFENDDDDEQLGRVTLVQCTKTKKDGCHEARDLYCESRYFRRMKEWAEAKEGAEGQPWFILSAKEGLVGPDQVLCDYDERGLSETQGREIAAELARRGVHTVDITAGKDYTEPLVPALEQEGIEVVEHFAGEAIGNRERLLSEATDRLRIEEQAQQALDDVFAEDD